MGIVFGVTGSKEPVFKTLRSCGSYEIRKYGKTFIAEIEKTRNSHGADQSFRSLAKYIGVFGEPQNRLPDTASGTPMAMTAPVLTTEKKGVGVALAMTAPVLTNEQTDIETMSFVLPDSFTRMEDIPVPTDPNIHIKEVPSRVVAAITFSGLYSSAVGEKYFRSLSQQLRTDGYVPEDNKPPLTWSVAQYHPPFTLPFLRRNEVWVDLDESLVNQRISEEN